MSSQGSSREEERRLNVRTLVIASAAAATAAVVTSQFWIAGTPIAAAITPLVVTLVSELLNRPTEKIVGRFTSETDGPPKAADVGPQPRGEPVVRPQSGREQPELQRAREAPVTVYRQPATPKGKRDLPWRTILVTTALAFAIAAAVLTLPELIAGQSIGKGDGKTSILGGNRNRGSEEPAATPTETAPPETEPQPTTPEKPEKKPPAQTETERTATQTTPAPAPKAVP